VKVSIIIPIYNEKNTLRRCIDRVQRTSIDKEIIIVDDFSIDGSRELLKNIKKLYSNIKIIYHSVNKGKGAALKRGIEHATGDYVLVQDADLEYSPEDYVKLIEVVKRKGAKIVYGTRFKHRKMSVFLIYYLANKFLTFLTNILYGSSLTDIETCYKLIKLSLIKELDLKAERFEFESEVTAKFLKKGYKIHEVPIQYKNRKVSEGKKIGLIDFFKAILCLIKYKFKD